MIFTSRFATFWTLLRQAPRFYLMLLINRNGLLNFEVYVMNTDGGAQTRLTTDSAVDGEPAWSPDGNRIDFSTNRDGVLNFEVYVMNANGSGQTKLTTNPRVDASPDW
jgi:Tol biopolymer transport system component